MKVLTENLPKQLQGQGLFCLWRYEPDKSGRITKVPYNPNSYKDRGSSTDPRTFAPMDKAVGMQAISGYDGLGVGVFGRVSAIDIDHCIDPAGRLSEMAQDIVTIMDAYTEKSPSGEGIRILFYAEGVNHDKEQFYINNQKRGLEVYVAGVTSKYVTVTGNVLRPADMVDRSAQLQIVLDKYMRRPQSQQEEQKAPAAAPAPVDLSDMELIERAKAAGNGDKFTRLWAGSWEGYYQSQSEADMALCELLAFWTRKDAGRIGALFRQSGLGKREKWNREDYRTDTINKAIARTQEVYDPKRAQLTAAEAFTPVEPEPVADVLQAFMEKVQGKTYEPIPTGIKDIDRALSGGLFRQTLMLLGAAPAMGKTVVAQYIMEKMAAAGQTVIYFNLEMSREQMIARSLSRRAWKLQGADISALNVLQGYKWTPEQKTAIQAAAAQFEEDLGDRMQYMELESANLDRILATMKAEAERQQAAGRPAPLVCVDYLQLIQGKDNEEEARAIKRAVKALKDYAIQYKSFVLAIMAQNRESNKKGKSDISSGRDTSALEYGGDVICGLDYTALWGRRKDESGEKYNAEKIRALIDHAREQNAPLPMLCNEVSLIIHKSRFGEAGHRADLLFDGKHNNIEQKENAYHVFGSSAPAAVDPAAPNWKEKRGLRTLQDVGAQIGITAADLARIEAGKLAPTREQLAALTAFYDM